MVERRSPSARPLVRTAKNQLTLPKRITNELGEVRNKLAELDLTEQTIRDAVHWARGSTKTS